MAIAIPNYKYAFKLKGKPIYVPTGVGRRIGEELKAAVEEAHAFDANYFHLKRGGHVAALHHHRDSEWFARIDITRFFYSVSRRRVQSALDRIGLNRARFFAQWSTVKNPYGEPLYSLPYGFVQSPILASLVVATSGIGDHLRSLEPDIRTSIYMDDIALSGSDQDHLLAAYEQTLALLEQEGFKANEEKLRAPSQSIDIFNCDLSEGRTIVRDERIAEFLAVPRSDASEEAFAAYCASVEAGNSI
jgi:hypothetical protein